MTTTPLLMNELSSLYAQFDVNGDGSITAQEVEQVLTSMAAVITPKEADALRQLLQEKHSIRRDDFLQWAQQRLNWDSINCCGTSLIWWIPTTTAGSAEKNSSA